jgi:hypothetical protein
VVFLVFSRTSLWLARCVQMGRRRAWLADGRRAFEDTCRACAIRTRGGKDELRLEGGVGVMRRYSSKAMFVAAIGVAMANHRRGSA